MISLRPRVLLLLMPALWGVVYSAVNPKPGEGSSTTILDPLEVPDPAGGSESVGRELVEFDAVLRRTGTGPVRSAGLSGVAWITLEPVAVTIRIRPDREGVRLHELPAGLWPELTDTVTLAGAVAETPAVPWVDLPTAGRAAAGTVLVLSDAAGDTVFRITGSAATMTDRGTKVELVGRVRRQRQTPSAGH